MRKLCAQLIKVIPLLAVMVASLCVNAQNSDFNFTIENDIQTANNILEFDLYVSDTDNGAVFKLSTIQAGIVVNPGIYNGGEITISIVDGSSDLTNTFQQPVNVLWEQSRNVIEMTPPAIPDVGSASIIRQLHPGTRICRMRLTNTQPFTAYSQANLTFSFTSPYPYPTKIAQFLTEGLNKSTEVVCNSTNCFNHSANIVLNATPISYDVMGSGTYCQGNTGLTVTLSNSQKGINYQLKNTGVKDGDEIAGTGGPLTWINKSTGNYQIEAVNVATLIPNKMSGNAFIYMNPSPATKAGSDFGICSGGSHQLGRTSITGNTYSWTSVPAGFSATVSNPWVNPLVNTTYTVVETITATGCTNSKSVVATVHSIPTIIITNPAPECSPATIDLTAAAVTMGSETELTYTYWTDESATTSYGTPASAIEGTYFIKGETWIGCYDIKPVFVIVDSSPTITISTPATCSANPLEYSIKVTASSGVLTSTAGSVYNNSNVWTIKEIPSGTDIILTLTDNNCSKTLSVTAPDCNCPVIAAPVSGGDKHYCAGSSIPAINASVQPGETVDWYATPTGGMAVFSGSISYIPSYAGTYYAEARNASSNCKSSSRTAVIITENPLPSAAAGIDRAVCLNASTIIGAVAVSGSTYSWSSLPAGFASTVSAPTVNPPETTTYILVETIILTGCTNTHSVVITVNPLPVAIAGNDRTLCFNTGTTIGAAGISESTYSWSSLPGGFISAEANPEVNPLTTTVYTIVETNKVAGCTNTQSVVVTVNPLPEAVAGDDRGICPGSSTILGAIPVLGSVYSWSSVPAGFSSASANPSVNPQETTIYTVIETISATGCSNTKSVVVTINPLPLANAGSDRAICLNSSTVLGASAVTGSIYSWTSAPSGSIPTIAEPTVNPLVTTTYTLIETISATGCFNTKNVVVTVNPLTGEAGVITGNDSFTPGSKGVAYSVESIINATSYIWTYTGTGVTINGTGTNVTLDFSATASSGSLTVKGHNDCGDGVESSLSIGDTKTLNLTSVMLEGLYAGNSTMNQAQDENGAHWPAGVADHITVELHDASSYGTVVYTASDIPLSTEGSATVIIPGAYNGFYYITIKHRNSIKTASATAKSFAGSSISQSYDNLSEVYGGNLIQTNEGYANYGGDSNQDGIVDSIDMLETENDATVMIFGYFASDVNGDGLVDSVDMILAENNATTMVMEILP